MTRNTAPAPTTRPRLAAAAVACAIQAAQPLMIWGAPGIGKSAIVQQAADAAGLPMIDVRAVQLDAVDVRGLPTISPDGRTRWAAPDFLPTSGAGVLFLDELPAAPPLVQAALYQLILDRRIGDYELPDGWRVIAAGNRETDRAVAHKMGTALANRFAHLTMGAHLDDWIAWALDAGIRTELLAFLKFRPELLHAFDPKTSGHAFPSPRTWQFVDRIMNTAPAAEIEATMYAGIVGEGAAAELLGFLRIWRSLPMPDQIIHDPDGAPIPSDPATLYATAGALARKASGQTFDAIARYLKRLPGEFGALCAMDAVRRAPDVAQTRGYIEWTTANADLFA